MMYIYYINKVSNMVGTIAVLILFIIVVAACCSSSDGSSNRNNPPKRNTSTARNNNRLSSFPYSECPSCGAPYYDGYCEECGYPDINQGWLGEEYG